MPTRVEVLERLERGETYATVAQAFGIAPGKAYMIATGRPADGDPDGDQALVNPRATNPPASATARRSSGWAPRSVGARRARCPATSSTPTSSCWRARTWPRRIPSPSSG